MIKKTSRTSTYNYEQLLSASIKDAYTGNVSLERIVVLDLKATFAQMFNKLNRLISGMFGNGISFEVTETDRELFARTFPLVYANVGDDLEGWFEMLENMRNVNMHARNMHFSKRFVGYQTNQLDWMLHADDIPLVNDYGEITMAGMISIILSMSNVSMIRAFLKSDKGAIRWYLINKLHGYESGQKWDDYAIDLYQLTKNDFESDIRVYEPGLDILTSVLGKFADSASIDGNRFELVIDDSEYDSIQISGEIGGNTIHVDAGSNYIVDYIEDYYLRIDNTERFVELSSSLPPFALLAYLKEKSETVFIDIQGNDLKLLMKLNKPKFYVDKNVHILLVGAKDCDIRSIQEAITSKIQYCFMNFEDMVYGYYDLPIDIGHSSLRGAIDYFGIDQDVRYKTLMIRNFFAHRRTLGEWVRTKNGQWYQVTLDFILETLPQFANEIGNKNWKNGSILRQDLYYRIILPLFTFRYSDQIKFGNSVFDGSLCGQADIRMSNLNLRVTSSSMNDRTEELMNVIVNMANRKGYVHGEFVLDSVQKIVIRNPEKKQITLRDSVFNSEEIVLYATRYSRHEIENVAEFVSSTVHPICVEKTYVVK